MKKVIIAVFSLLLCNSIHADEVQKVDSLINLKEVVVSANKIVVNRNSVPLSISVIGRDDIETSSESALLPVLSQRVPGLFVTQRGITGFGVSTGAAGTVNIRGVGQGNKVLMLFDGQPQWAGLFGHALPDTYVASDVDRVEVIRGPGSLLYGSNAMGGVVNIITRKHHQEGRRTQARVMYGSYNTQKYMVNNGFNSGKFSSFISLNHDRTDGHRPNSEFKITNGFGKVGYQLSNHFNATADVSLAKFKNQNPGAVTAPMIDNDMDILRGTTSLAVENNYGKTSGAVRAFYNWGDHEINDGYTQGGQPRTFLFNSKDHNYGLLLYQSFRLLPGNSFTLGLDYKNWGGEAWNAYFDGKREDIVDKKIDETAGYLIMQQDIMGLFTVNGGLRYEYNSVFGGEWVPQAGVVSRLFEGNTIRASLSRGFRSPNIREMYMYPIQNADLKPESMYNYEVAVSQSFLDNRLFAELTGFYIDGKDLIEVRPLNGKPLNQNVGEFTNKGIEAELRFQVLSNLSIDANYSYLNTDKRLLAAPKNQFFAGVNYSPGRFNFSLNMQSISGLYTDTNEATAKKENYTLVNARAAYLFGTRDKGLTLFLKGENLTATRYEINQGFPMPKAIVMGGVEVTF